ncbi:MAG: outer membrane protein assembly factor BamA, partial [Bdellovibrionales bacterium]|nr:outer membrane protein assembly factor BamA [Bdellovibrionales bacterium]
FLDRAKIEAGISEAKKHYQSLGYYDAEISYTVTPVGDNQVDLTFRVDEGEESVLRRIVFEGNQAFDDDDLADEIPTSRYRWWSSWLTGGGLVKEDQLAEDARALTRFYLNNGYADVRIGEPEIRRVDDGLELIFRIHEGEQYEFAEIHAAGDLLDGSEEKTLEGITAAPGDTFSVDVLREDAFTVSEKFTDIGYAFANVDPVTDVNRAERKVRITFRVDKGQLVTVDRILVTGNQKTRDNVVRRTLKIQERELFSSSKIERSQELLSRTGYFDEVTITPQSTEKADEVDLNVAVREGTTGTFSAGAGVSSGDGFIANARVSENNLLGRGMSLALDIDLGSRNENFVVSFDNPRVDDGNWSLGFDVLSVEREFDDFNRQQRGASVTGGYPLIFLGPEYLDDVRFSLTYEFLKVNIDDVGPTAPILIQNEQGTSTSSSVTPRIVRNTIDNPLNPTEGSRQVLSMEVAGLGGNEEFWLGEAASTLYYPLFDTGLGPIVFSQRTRFGYGDTFNGEPLPLFKRYFPGGINSVRGYDARELGPKDEAGNEFGGSKQLVFNFEVIFPIAPALGLKGLVFYDTGEAFDDNENIDFAELRQAAGWGVRWNSPLGPIRIEIG